MSQVPAELKYAKSHEWARLLPDGRIEIGITDHAQQALGDDRTGGVPGAKEEDVSGTIRHGVSSGWS